MQLYTVIGYYADTNECSFNDEVKADSWQEAARKQIQNGVTVVAVIEGCVSCSDDLDFAVNQVDDPQLAED